MVTTAWEACESLFLGSIKLFYYQNWFLSVFYPLFGPQALANHMAQLSGW